MRAAVMVERSDRAPLLDWEEVEAPTPEKPASERQGSCSPPISGSTRALGYTAPGFGWSTSPGGPRSLVVAETDGGGDAPPSTSSADAAAPRPAADADEHPSGLGPGDVSLVDGGGVVQWEEKDQIVSVFVVTFNTRSGGT